MVSETTTDVFLMPQRDPYLLNTLPVAEEVRLI